MLAKQTPQTSTTNDGDGDGYSPRGYSLYRTLPSSQQLGIDEGDFDNVRSTGQQYQQQPSQRSLLPYMLPSSQQLEANEGAVDDFDAIFRSTGLPHQQQFCSISSSHPQQSSQGAVNPQISQTSPPSQQYRVNEMILVLMPLLPLHLINSSFLKELPILRILRHCLHFDKLEPEKASTILV